MFEAYRIRPVVETEGNDESKDCQSFATESEATAFVDSVIADGLADGENREDLLIDYQIRTFWTLYGVNPIDHGVRTDDAICDADTEDQCRAMLQKIVGPTEAPEEGTGYIYPSPKNAGRKLTDKEINTILHGLRIIQELRAGIRYGCKHAESLGIEDSEETACDHFTDHKPLTDSHIDDLCESINLDGVVLLEA